MKLKLVTPPTQEPVSLALMKAHLRVTHSAEDDLITAQIKAARAMCENAARMSFITQTWRATYRLPQLQWDVDFSLRNEFDDPDKINSGLNFLRGPVQSVTAAKVYHTPDTMIDLDNTIFLFNADSQRIEWTDQGLGNLLSSNDFLQVDYVAGLDVTSFGNRYPDIVEAIKITVQAFYDERGYSRQAVPPAAAHILAPYWTSPTYIRPSITQNML